MSTQTQTQNTAISKGVSLEAIRLEEIGAVRPNFAPGERVLEIGGGKGHQASILASWGCDVSSIDIADRPKYAQTFFPVIDYDGTHIPFPDNTFDVVFSSNVLEHIPDVNAYLQEIQRVLKPGAKAVHVLPSATWRIWTFFAHYPYLVKRVLFRNRKCRNVENEAEVGQKAQQRGWFWVLKRILIPGPHGEYPNALTEFHTFSGRRWNNVFVHNGYRVERRSGTGIFYTGYGLFDGLTLEKRRMLAGLLGSACHIFVLRTQKQEKQ